MKCFKKIKPIVEFILLVFGIYLAIQANKILSNQTSIMANQTEIMRIEKEPFIECHARLLKYPQSLADLLSIHNFGGHLSSLKVNPRVFLKIASNDTVSIKDIVIPLEKYYDGPEFAMADYPSNIIQVWGNNSHNNWQKGLDICTTSKELMEHKNIFRETSIVRYVHIQFVDILGKKQDEYFYVHHFEDYRIDEAEAKSYFTTYDTLTSIHCSLDVSKITNLNISDDCKDALIKAKIL